MHHDEIVGGSRCNLNLGAVTETVNSDFAQMHLMQSRIGITLAPTKAMLRKFPGCLFMKINAGRRPEDAAMV